MKIVKLKLFVTSVLTLTGKKKRYVLDNMAYGEYLVYKGGCPQYYLNILDVPNIKYEADNIDITDYIEMRLGLIEKGLTLKSSIKGIRLKELPLEWVELKVLPTYMLINSSS